MNRKTYFSTLGKHTQEQVNGQEAILNEAVKRGAPLTLAAYALATAHHETGGTFGPVTENLNYTSAARIKQVWPKRFPTLASAEPYVRNPRALANKVYGDRKDLGNRPGTDDGWNYRGRNIPQITGRGNYAKWGLQDKPDDALKMDVGARILLDGLEKGMFTGKKVSDYDTYKAMRATVNGDVAANGATVAAWAEKYEAALRAAGYGKFPTDIIASSVIATPIAAAWGLTDNIWPFVAISAVMAVGFLIYRSVKK